MKSIWQKTCKTEAFAPLAGDKETDVLIIGGGLCGLLCAYRLQQAGIDYLLLEAEKILDGVSKNTTAKVTVQHGLIYRDVLRRYGKEATKQYFAANDAALCAYRSLAETIDCDFEEKDAYVYSLTDAKKIKEEIFALDQIGVKATFRDTLPLPFSVAGAVKLEGQAQFHPLKFASAISRGLHIHEHTRVRELIGTKAVTSGGTVSAKRIIVATHFPFLNKHGGYFLKLYQHRSYVLAFKNAPQVAGMYVDEAEGGLSFRNYGDLLLLGGGSHRTGKKGGGWEELRAFARQYFPNAVEVAHWATQDCMSLDGIPYIGAYSSHTDGLYVASGFHKWGMTSSMVAATLLTELLQGKENQNAAVFAPDRSVLHPQLFVNAWEALIGLLTPTAKRCPHLGCALKWNPQEHTWDCSCHGSRFSGDGRLIDNPATGDLKK